MLPLKDMVIVSTKGSIFYAFDSHSAKILQKFDVSPITRHLGELVGVETEKQRKPLLCRHSDILISIDLHFVLAQLQ